MDIGPFSINVSKVESKSKGEELDEMRFIDRTHSAVMTK